MILKINQLDTEIGACEQGQLIEFRLVHKHSTLSIELYGKPYAVIKNPRGDICQLLDQQVPISTYRYEAFGLSAHIGVEIPWQFCGQRYTADTQLYHFEKREYDPSTGRWLTPDPLGFADGPNLFAYVHNNPLGFVDPCGLWREEIKDFFRGSSRGFADDTTWNASSHLLGPYRPSTRAGQWGYHLGTGVSMAASLLYGGAELRLLRGALSVAKKMPVIVYSTKSLRETHAIVKASSNTSPIKQIFEDVISAEKSFGKKNILTQISKTDNIVSKHSNLTPQNFFKNKTYTEIENLLTAKFGPPRGGGIYNKSFYNTRTKRTFNMHHDPAHKQGKPHVDIRKRGLDNDYYAEKPYFLKE